MLSSLKRVFKQVLSYMGYKLIPKGLGYFDSTEIVSQAQKHNLSVTEYLETFNVGGVGKRRDEIITQLQELKVLKVSKRILEIGAGTGMFTERFIEICKPDVYEIYETDKGWSKYLKDAYSDKVQLIIHNAKGDSLHNTADSSCDIITAHGVFVYLPVVTTFQYLQEAIRVCKDDGLIVFDIFSDKIFTAVEILNFKEKNPKYDFPVVIKEETLEEFCIIYNLKKLASFDINYHYTKSTYFILKKNSHNAPYENYN